MVEWCEVQIQTLEYPYGVKIEKNSKGYNYEVSVHTEDWAIACQKALDMRAHIERQLGIDGGNHEEQKA